MVDRTLLATGKVGVSWKVLDAGPGVGRWAVSSLTLGRKGARWVQRASGRERRRRRCGSGGRAPTGCG